MKPRAASFGALAADVWGVLAASPFWLAAHVATLAALGALEPGAAWVAKDAVGALEKAQGTLADLALPNASLYLAIALGLALLRLAEHFSNKVYEATVVFALQRVLLRRRPEVRPGEDATRMVYDCIEAKKALSPLYTNLWRDLCKLAAVALWQLSLAPAWLPALGLSLLPPVVGILGLAPHVQKAKRRVLEDNCRVTAHAPEGVTDGLLRSQRRLLGGGSPLGLLPCSGGSGSSLCRRPLLQRLLHFCQLLPNGVHLGLCSLGLGMGRAGAGCHWHGSMCR